MAKAIVAALAALAVLVPPAAEAAAKRTQIYAPRNDQFANAFRLTSSTNLVLGGLSAATRELGEPKITSGSLGRTIWYRYRASKAGRAVVVLTTGRYPTERHQLGVYKGSTLAGLTSIGRAWYDGNSTGSTDGTSAAVAFDTQAGQEYRIQVDHGALRGGPNAFFEIGLQQFGPEGGLAVFEDRTMHLSEGIVSLGTNTGKVLAANAVPSPVTVQGSLLGLPKGAFEITPSTAKTLGGGKTLWFEISDSPAATLTGPGQFTGAVRIESRIAATGAALPLAQRPLHAFRQDGGELGRPEILVRPKQILTGVLDRQPVTTPVYIRNESLVKAVGCRFTPPDANQPGATSYIDVGPSTAGKRSTPFDLEAGAEKVYDVTVAGMGVALRCVNLDTRFPGDHTALGYEGQFGVVASVMISTLGADVYNQIVLSNKSRTVVVKVENTGEYSGDFELSYIDTARSTLADVTSMCISGPTGLCVSPSTTATNTTINLAPGEVGHLALKVTRGTNPEPGAVALSVRPQGRGTGTIAGFGAFELISR